MPCPPALGVAFAYIVCSAAGEPPFNLILAGRQKGGAKKDHSFSLRGFVRSWTHSEFFIPCTHVPRKRWQLYSCGRSEWSPGGRRESAGSRFRTRWVRKDRMPRRKFLLGPGDTRIKAVVRKMWISDLDLRVTRTDVSFEALRSD